MLFRKQLLKITFCVWADLLRLNKQISISALYLVYFEAAICKIVLSAT